MNARNSSTLRLNDGRFTRFESLEWWNQSTLKKARVLVVGAGALGNELIKNLALLGVGNLVIVDMDRIEKSNLSRSILFREKNEGQFKVHCAASQAKEIYSDINITPIAGNILSDVGFGYFHWAQVVAGALDNREARVFVNNACTRVNRPWFDGGIEVLHGIIRGFAPPQTACYECTLSQKDWDIINQRRSCSLLARRAITARGTPTTPTTASVIGGIQAQEIVKWLHGLESLSGKGFFFDGLSHQSYAISYPINPECPHHDPFFPIESCSDANSLSPLHVIAQFAKKRLGGLDAIDFGREIVRELSCPSCNLSMDIWRSSEIIEEDQALCPECGSECIPKYIHSIPAESELLDKTPSECGLPNWDIIWARYGDTSIGIEIRGDHPSSLNP